MRNVWRLSAGVLVVAGGLVAPSAGAAERPWIEVRSPHFTVVSNAGEHPAQEIAWQFELVRAVFDAVWPWARRDETRPFVVFVARDEGTLRALAPQYWTSRNRYGTFEAHVSGVDADYSAIRVDFGLINADGRANPYEAAFEGYADNVLVRHFSGRMPTWFREGLIELFGNVIVGEKDVQIGRPIGYYMYLLSGGAPTAGRVNFGGPQGVGPASRKLLPLERLVGVRREDPEFTGDGERSLYAAQAWAFVHFLMFSDGGARRPAFNRVMDLLRGGGSADEATAQALGDVSLLNQAYRDYIDKRYFQSQRLSTPALHVKKEKWPVRPVPAAEAEVLKARFLTANGQLAAARERIAAARVADPSFAGIAEAEALVEGRARRPATTAIVAPGAASTPFPSPADQIRACNGGDEAACGRLATRLQAECDHDAAMCMPLAFLYEKGRGVPRDPMQAEELYARACEADQLRACEKRARMILERSGAEGNVAEARALLQRACAGGEKTACAVMNGK